MKLILTFLTIIFLLVSSLAFSTGPIGNGSIGCGGVRGATNAETSARTRNNVWLSPANIPSITRYDHISDYDADFDEAIADIATTETTLIVDEACTMSANTIVPSTLSLRVLKGCPIDRGGYKLTINGPFEAGLYQVFSGNGDVVFGSGSIDKAYSEWWGIDGVSDQTEINKALAAFPHVCLLPNKTYTDSNSIILKSNSILEGFGWTTVITLANGANCPMIHNESWSSGSDSNITIKNLKLEGNSANQSSGLRQGIFLRNVTNFHICNVCVNDVYSTGIFLPGDADGIVENCLVSDIVALCGIYVGYPSGPWYSGESTRIKIVDCTAYSNYQDGILFQVGSEFTAKGNFSYNNGRSGIKCGSEAVRFLIVDNHACFNDTGIHIQMTSHGIISENYLYRNESSGIQLSDGGTANQTIENILIDSNVVCENGQGGSQRYGIHLLGEDSTNATFQSITITNNRCIDYQDTPTQNYGLKGRVGTYQNIYVGGNYFEGNALGSVAWSASDADITYGYNCGYESFMVPETVERLHFYIANVDANATTTYLTSSLDTTIDGYKLPKDGNIVGVYAMLNDSITAGTLTILPKKNLSGFGGSFSITSTEGDYNYKTADPGAWTFSAGDTLQVAYISDSSLLPDGTADLWVVLEVVY